jgi:hypothetical protein
VEAKGVPHLGTGAKRRLKKRQHGVPRESIGKVICIEFVENVTGDKT